MEPRIAPGPAGAIHVFGIARSGVTLDPGGAGESTLSTTTSALIAYRAVYGASGTFSSGRILASTEDASMVMDDADGHGSGATAVAFRVSVARPDLGGAPFSTRLDPSGLDDTRTGLSAVFVMHIDASDVVSWIREASGSAAVSGGHLAFRPDGRVLVGGDARVFVEGDTATIAVGEIDEIELAGPPNRVVPSFFAWLASFDTDGALETAATVGPSHQLGHLGTGTDGRIHILLSPTTADTLAIHGLTGGSMLVPRSAATLPPSSILPWPSCTPTARSRRPFRSPHAATSPSRSRPLVRSRHRSFSQAEPDARRERSNRRSSTSMQTESFTA